MKLAIIAAAGWKGCSSRFPDIEPGVPEPLLPLGNGDTLLSRQARQLRELGFMVFAAVGRPGCTYPFWGRHTAGCELITMEGAEEGIRHSPWTWKRVAYVAEHAIPIIIPDPDSISRHGTNCLAIEALGAWTWDRLLLTAGDHLNTDEVLQEVIEQPCPSQIILGGHVWFWLTSEAAHIYCGLAHRHTRARIWYKQGGLAAKLFAQVAPQRHLDGWGDRFIDVDVAKDYRLALKWIQEHK